MALPQKRVTKKKDETKLKELYERPIITQSNPVDKKWFAQLGRCQGFEARPGVMHFDGFQTGEIHTQYLKIINISGSAKRMHIINPTTKEFTVRVEKRGILAPGMAETIAIDFEPSEWRYHYDCIRIYTEADNLLIPIHGYPVVNAVNFPPKIDFGDCPLKESKKRVVSLGCKVPIQFEYRIELTKHNPDFTISPLQGLIPANGISEVLIEFIPLNFGTYHLEFILHVSQFSFKPMKCHITASCVPGLVRDHALDIKASQLLDSKGSGLTLGSGGGVGDSRPGSGSGDSRGRLLSPQTFGIKLDQNPSSPLSSRGHEQHGRSRSTNGNLESLYHNAAVDLMDTNLPLTGLLKPKGVGSGAVLDGGADYMSKSAITSATLQRKNRPYKKNKRFVPSEQIVEGLLIPDNLNTTSSINYILTQQVGKLKPKALQEAIIHQKQVRAEQLQQQAEIRSAVGGGGGGGGLSVHAIKAEEGSVSSLPQRGDVGNQNGGGNSKQSRQAREMAFLQDLKDTAKEEKTREFKSSKEAIGVKMLTPEEIDVIIAQRELVKDHTSYIERSHDRSILQTVFKGPKAKEHSNTFRAQTIATNNQNQNESQNKSDEANNKQPPPPPPFYFQPTFDLQRQDVWSKRRNTLARFIYLIGKWIIRNRANKRLKAIKTRLGNANTREAVRALVEIDNQQASNNEGGGASGGAGGNGELMSLESAPPRSAGALLLAEMGCAESELNCLKFELLTPLSGGGDGSSYENERSQLKNDDGGQSTNYNDLIQPTLFPSYEEDSGTVRTPVDACWTSSISFSDLTYMDASAPQEAQLMNYECPISSPCVDSFAPYRDRSSGIRIGATEESGIRAPRGGGGNNNKNDDDDGKGGKKNGSKSPTKKNSSKSENVPPPPPTNGSMVYNTLFDNKNNMNKINPIIRVKELSKPMIEYFTPFENQLYESNRFRPTHSKYKVFNPKLAIPIETDINWNLRPQIVPYDLPTNYGSRLSCSIGTNTLHSLKDVPTQSQSSTTSTTTTSTSTWLQRRDRRSSTLNCLPNQHKQTLWGHFGLPDIEKEPNQDDVMSDSESEDEEGDQVTIPTPDLARGFFDPDLENMELGTETPFIMRDIKMLQLEEANLESRHLDAVQLPKRMEAIGDEIVNLSNKFLLQKPYHTIETDRVEIITNN